MNRNVSKIEKSIQRMTAVVRQDMAIEVAKSFGEETDPDIKPLGWWILACGDPLDEDSFKAREKIGFGCWNRPNGPDFCFRKMFGYGTTRARLNSLSVRFRLCNAPNGSHAISGKRD